jgi:C4-dicarboxylate-specific signal transduction histidine kinase
VIFGGTVIHRTRYGRGGIYHEQIEEIERHADELATMSDHLRETVHERMAKKYGNVDLQEILTSLGKILRERER